MLNWRPVREIEERTRRIENEILRVRSDDGRIEKELLQVESDIELIESEILRVRSDDARIEKELLQVESDIELIESEILRVESDSKRLEAETAKLREHNAKEKALSASIRALCFPPESSSIPAPPTEPDCGPSSP